ncbi:hypothetical protein F5148DRAFT_489760 [Russula earlei]|uniref:Uncharacterized protein n=1 Tax=Russula earlei TaxID=71964 RepID=A0ACC0UH68_9AGAM|nr:hypothetical protein F5148DRAFT_489760 [Russula earlei]
MNAWAIFRRARITLFTFLVLLCLAWTTLFAVFLTHEWSHFSRFQNRDCSRRLAVTLWIHRDPPVFDDCCTLSFLVGCCTRDCTSCQSIPEALCSSPYTVLVFLAKASARKRRAENFVFTILIGCWVFSGIVLCVAIALGIMAFIPRPVESLPGGDDDEDPSSPGSFKAGTPSEERQISFYSVDSRTGLVSYQDQGDISEESLSPDHDLTPVNESGHATVVGEPPLLWQGFQSKLRLSNGTPPYDAAMSMRNAPGERTSLVSGPQRTDPYIRNPFRDPSLAPAFVHSPASMVKTGVGGEKLPGAPAPLDRTHEAFSPISLHDPPPLVTIQRERATEYTPVLDSILNHYSRPAAVGNNSQSEEASPGLARMITSGAFSHHSAAASVHSKWEASTPHTLPPPVLTPGAARFQQPSRASGGLKELSLLHNPLFGAGGPNAALKRQASDPTRTVQRFGGSMAPQPLRRSRWFCCAER